MNEQTRDRMALHSMRGVRSTDEEIALTATHAAMPLLIRRGWCVLWCNRRAEEMLRATGLLGPWSSLVGKDLLQILAGQSGGDIEALVAADASLPDGDLRSVLTVCQAGAQRFAILRKTIQWQGAPAMLSSWVVIGVSGQGPDLLEGTGLLSAVATGRSLWPSETLATLSPREREVAALVAEGFGTDHIAALLGSRPATVRTQLKSIYRKTGVHSRATLVRLVLDR